MPRRILFLSQNLPYPPDAGVKSRTYNVIRQLARRFDLTMLCFVRKAGSTEGMSVEDRARALGEFGEVRAFDIPEEVSAGRKVLNHVSSLASGKVYTRFSYASRAYFGAIESALHTAPPELVHLDSLDLAGYLPLLPRVPVACTHHDVQSLLLARRAARSGNPLVRWYLQHQAELTREDERTSCPRVTLNVMVSEADGEAIREITGCTNVVVVPNGVDIEYFTPSNDRPRSAPPSILFVGGSTWFPNADAMDFFAHQILPAVRTRVPDVRVQWVGRLSEDVRARFARIPGMDPVGFVPDIRPYLAGAACVIAPLRVGGGTRIKILDAWASGNAVVSTTIGCEGLRAVDGVNTLIRDDPAGFAEAVAHLVNQPAESRRIGIAARQTAVADYSWDQVGGRLTSTYEALITKGGAL